MNKIILNAEVLSRDEMKKILGGCEGNDCTNCLICWNDGSDAESILYPFTGEDPELACRRNGFSSGSWGQCSDIAVN